MDQPHDAMTTEADRGTVVAQISRHSIALLRATASTALLIIYVVWTLAVSSQILIHSGGGATPYLGALIGLAFLMSLPGFGYLCTVRDKNGNFAAPSVMVVLIFISYGLLAGVILVLGLSLALETSSTVGQVAMWAGILSPILSVALSMPLAGIVRTRLVWEPESTRLKTAKYWLYLSPPSLFLICQALYAVGHLVG
ncbi:hypothetical protein [Arthrobacter sp. HY1533]|uniref:hypothetical protein n=1 Tax=Arthrobacter sp. HY1533 TaxID=2970919 RepID=UPI0022BA0FF8|nr:hypothetical protein [Arthrobacter sp. HY1533]